jgi:hypothetical protein
MSIKLEVGKTYTTRGGERVTLTEHRDMLEVSSYYKAGADCYHPDGRRFGCDSDSHLNLVLEEPAATWWPSILELNVEYRTNGGYLVTFVKRDVDGDLLTADGGLWFKSGRKFCETKDSLSFIDLDKQHRTLPTPVPPCPAPPEYPIFML